MANVCKNTITIIGLQEAPEHFVKALSKAMFNVDLDNLDPTRWGDDASVDGATWYEHLVEEYRHEGSYASRFCILYREEPYVKFGITMLRFYVETKWETPIDKLCQVSKLFPDLTFHVDWWRLQDVP